MRKTTALCLALALPALGRAASPESLKRAADESFRSLSGFKAEKPASFERVSGRPVDAGVRYASTSSRHVRVSGEVRLSGTGIIPRGSSFATVHLTGSADFQDDTGRVRSGYTTVTYQANIHVNGSWVTDYIRPSVYVSFYRDGRYLGSAQMDGSVYVSGHVSHDMVSLSGSGTLSGNIWVNEDIETP